MMQRTFLIDLENINHRFIPGMESLNSNDKVILFYSEQEQLTMDILSALANTKAAVERRLCKQHTKNAMDFQICSYLGILVDRNHENCEYYIVSLDKGYTAAVEMVKDIYRDVNVEIVKNCRCEKQAEEVRTTIDMLLETFSRKVRKEAEDAVKRSNNTSELHNYLQLSLKRDGKLVYEKIKPYYHQLKSA